MTEENETKQNPRGSGYSTRQKASLIRFLESHPEEFLTAKEIHEGLVASGEKIGYTTVYRLVNALSEEAEEISDQERRPDCVRIRAGSR